MVDTMEVESHYSSTHIVYGNALETSFGDAIFERVYSQNVVMDIANKQTFYCEAYRVLNPGGLLPLRT